MASRKNSSKSAKTVVAKAAKPAISKSELDAAVKPKAARPAPAPKPEPEAVVAPPPPSPPPAPAKATTTAASDAGSLLAGLDALLGNPDD